jgi:hypothetical protein
MVYCRFTSILLAEQLICAKVDKLIQIHSNDEVCGNMKGGSGSVVSGTSTSLAPGLIFGVSENTSNMASNCFHEVNESAHKKIAIKRSSTQMPN